MTTHAKNDAAIRRTVEDLHSLVVGDIGGIHVPCPDASARDCQLVEDLNSMWTGISLDQVAAVARRAEADASKAGVVVVALRRERAPTLVEVVRRGLATHLVIDHDAASGLNACLREPG